MQYDDASPHRGSAESQCETSFLDPTRKRRHHFPSLNYGTNVVSPMMKTEPDERILQHPPKRYLSDLKRKKQKPIDPDCCSYCYRRLKKISGNTNFKLLYDVYSPSSDMDFWQLIMLINADNMRSVWRKLLKMDIVGKMGTLCFSILECQLSNTHITSTYASLISRLNLVCPGIGRLLLHICLNRFIVALDANLLEKCKPIVEILAYLVIHNVAHCIVAIDLLKSLAARPSHRDLMQMVLVIFKTCGYKINKIYPRETKQVVGMFRTTLRKKRYQNKKVRTILINLIKYRMIGFKFKNAPRLNTEELSIGSKHTPFLIRLNDINHPNPNYDSFWFISSQHNNKMNVSTLKMYKKISNEILKLAQKNEWKSFNCASTEGDDEFSEGEAGVEANEPCIKTILAAKLINGILVDSKTCYIQKAHYINAIQIVPRTELCHHFLNGCCKPKIYSQKGSRTIARLLCDLDASNAESLEIVFVDTYENAKDFHGEQFRFVVELFTFLLVEKSISWNAFSKINLSNVSSVHSLHFVKLLFYGMIAEMGAYQVLSYITQPQIIPAFKGILLNENEKISNFAVDIFCPDQLYLLARAFKKHHSRAPLKEAAVTENVCLKIIFASLRYAVLVFLVLFFFPFEIVELPTCKGAAVCDK